VLIEKTIAQHLTRAAATATPTQGLRFVDRREQETFYPWPTVWDRAHRTATTLEDLGVQRGHRVAIVLPTCQAFFDVYLGCQVMGAIAVPLYPPVRLGRLTEYHDRTAVMLASVQASIVVTNARIRRVLGEVLNLYRPPLGLVDTPFPPSTALANPNPHISPDDVAMIQFSSGTTVAPKPVALTHRQMLANARPILKLVNSFDEPEPAGVSWLPLDHDMGLIGCLFPALTKPGPLTLIPPEVFLAKPALWLRALSRHRGTVSPAPNFAYALCVERIKPEQIKGIDLSHWRMALNGAETIRPQTLTAFQERFAKYGLRPEALNPVYGLSEASLAVTFSDVHTPYRTSRFSRSHLTNGRAITEDEEGAMELVSLGTPLVGFEVQIRDEAGGEVPNGVVGRLWCRGPSLLHSYWQRDEHPVTDGWLDTGDLGFLHDGELYLTGRAKDVIILRGQNHAPHELEHPVDSVDGVRTGCAIAVANHTDDGERVVIFVEYRRGREGLAEDCRKAVLSATGVNPDLVVVVEPGTLPRTSSGKLRRSEALRRWSAGTLTAPSKVTPWFIAGAMARSALAQLKRR